MYKVKKIKRLFSLFLYSILISTLVVTQPVSAFRLSSVELPVGREDEFAENNILFYNPDGTACTTRNTMSSVDGDDIPSLIWNYLYQEMGVTNPAIAAGILGNMEQEVGFDPYQTAGGTGLIQIIDDAKQAELIKYQDERVPEGKSYWHGGNGDLSKTPLDIAKKGALAQLNFIFKDDPQWSAQTQKFFRNENVPTNKQGEAGAKGYSDLWLVDVEGAYPHGSTSLQDPGVKSHAGSHDTAHWQNADNRRNFSVKWYQHFSSSGTNTEFVPATTATLPTMKFAYKTGELNKIFLADTVTANGSNVFLVGDSISEAVNAVGGFDSLLPNMTVDAHFGRTFSEGIPILSSYIADHPETQAIVFALGTNQTNVSQSDIDSVLSAAGDRDVYFITNYGQPSSGDWKTAYTSNNNLFSSNTSNPKVHVIDWAKRIGGDGSTLDPEDYLTTDTNMEVHPNQKGIKLWAQMISEALGGSSSGNYADTCDCPPGTVTSYSSGAGGSSTVIGFDEDGWLNSGFPGYKKESAEGRSDLKETPASSYNTSDGKAHQILLHTTEGTGLGLSAYGDNMYPAHFMIDLKKKQVYQAFPITHPSLATKTSDKSTIQIEIVGIITEYVYGKHWASDPYYVPNFGDDDWDYLALLLASISSATGIPLSSSLDWSRVNRMSTSERDAYVGVMGHMHSPSPDDHSDPGNIWDSVSAAIARSPEASQFANGASQCGYGPGNGNVNATALALAWSAEEYSALSNKKENRPEYTKALSDVGLGPGSGVGDSCSQGGNSCDAFVATVMRYSGADPDFRCCGASNVRSYLEGSPKYIEVPNNKESLKPGDIRSSTGHVELVVSVDGELKIAGASHCDHTGRVTNFYENSGTFKAFRLKGN